MIQGKSFKPALNACVVMVRGIYNKWKLPIAYYFPHTTCRASDLKDIVGKCEAIAEHRLECGDMGSTNIKLSNMLLVSPEKPYFHVDSQKVFFLFDSPHLMKATRNNLLTNIFHWDAQKQTSWKYIQQFYNSDKSLANRLAPKLTEAHIHPTNREKMKVHLATQVLSAIVAAGLATYVSLNALPSDAMWTFEFIERFDKLFHICNSSSLSRGKEFNRAFKVAPQQIQFLDESLTFLSQMRVINPTGTDITGTIKSLQCWKVSIQGIKQLWELLKEKGYSFF